MKFAGPLRCIVMFLVTLGVAWCQVVSGADAPNSDPNSNTNTNDAPAKPGPSLTRAAMLPTQLPDSLFDLPRLNEDRASLIGGILESVDRLRGRFTLRPSGRGTLTIAFDPRTQFVRDGKAAGVQDMHPGDHVYIETVLDGTAVFARTIHLFSGAAMGTTVGQIVAYDAAQGNLSIRDQLAPRPVQFHVNSKTVVAGAGVGPGALVQVSFLGGKRPALVQEIIVLAAPGSVFSFVGRITFLDFASQELVLANQGDDNRYEIQFDPATLEPDAKEHMREGSRVVIAARFNGQRYVAESVAVLSHSTE